MLKFLKRTWKVIVLAAVVVIVSGQASGGIVEFWTPGPDLTVKNFRVVDLGMYTVPNQRCNNFGGYFQFVYGLADTITVKVLNTADTLKYCIAFVNVNPVTDEMFQSY